MSSIAIPNSVVSIGARALYGTAWLNNQPDGVVYAGKVAYTYKGAMPENTRIVLDSSTLGIAEEAFRSTNLTSVVIGENVSSIGGLAFGYCVFLGDVYCFMENGIPGTGNPIFHGNRLEYDTLHVPASVIEAYKSTYPWSEFGTIVALTDEDANMFKSFSLIYKVDGEVYKTSTVLYGTPLTPEAEPTKEGYTFSGWSEIPETMPAHDVTITGSFSINTYKLTYMIDNDVYKEVMYEYDATITPEPQPEGDYATFEWIDLPETMPAHDVVVHASYTTGIREMILAKPQDVQIYSPNGKKLNKLQKGLNIVIMQDGTIRKIIVK